MPQVGRVGTASRPSCLEVGAAPRAALVDFISGGGWQPRVAGGGMMRGRDVIAITSVGGPISRWPVTMPGSTHMPLRTAAMAMAALPMIGFSGWRLAVGRSRGNRRPDDWLGAFLSGPRFRPFGFRLLASGYQLLMAVTRHLEVASLSLPIRHPPTAIR